MIMQIQNEEISQELLSSILRSPILDWEVSEPVKASIFGDFEI